MAEYNPRNRNPRPEAPLSWSQKFYDARPQKERDPCGFHYPAQAIEARQGGDAKQAPSQDESAVGTMRPKPQGIQP